VSPVQEDVTEYEALRMKRRLLINPKDVEALAFCSVHNEWKSAHQRTTSRCRVNCTF
jgi:hypothetical protein